MNSWQRVTDGLGEKATEKAANLILAGLVADLPSRVYEVRSGSTVYEVIVLVEDTEFPKSTGAVKCTKSTGAVKCTKSTGAVKCNCEAGRANKLCSHAVAAYAMDKEEFG